MANTIGDTFNQDVSNLTAPVQNLNEKCLPKNTKNNRQKGQAKKSNTTISYGNDHGSIKFGQISQRADTTSDVLLQASDGRQALTMDKNGPRKGWTTITAPGNFQVRCGFDEGRKKEQDAMLLCADNGNINIVAVNGKIRLEADDIEIIARGEKTSEGNVRIKATENVELDGKKVLVNSKSFIKLASSGKIEIAANGCLKIYGSLIQGVTDSVSSTDSKVGGKDYQIAQLGG
jgi:lipopolysaccharide assembly outer membrane protein LptD (OstA)